MYKELMRKSREDLNDFMIAYYGYDQEQVNEWKSKEDLVDDIISFGHAGECMGYLA